MDFDETFSPTMSTYVCSIHFKTDDFVLENGCYELNPNAVPSIFIKEELIESVNTSDKNNEPDDCNDDLKIAGYKSMVEENEQKHFPDSSIPIIMAVCGTYPNFELNMNNLNSSKEPFYNNDVVNNGYQNQSFLKNQSLKKTKGNTSASTSSSTIPIDTVNRLKSSSSQHNSIQYDVSEDIENNLDSIWILNSPEQATFKDYLPAKFRKRLEYLAQENKRLISKSKALMTSKRMLLDIEIKYLHLRNKVLETEESLLEKGMNTSEYPVFRLAKDSTEILKDDVEHHVLLECKLAEVNNQLYNNSALQSTRLFTGVESPPDNENSMPEL